MLSLLDLLVVFFIYFDQTNSKAQRFKISTGYSQQIWFVFSFNV